MCLRNLLNVFGAWGPNRSWDIDLPAPNVFALPHAFAQINPVLSAWHSEILTHAPHVCQHLVTGQEICPQMFLSISGTYRKYLVHGAPIEAEILTSLLPNVFAQFGLVLGGDALPMGVFTHIDLQVVYKCSYMSQKPPK